MNMEKERAMDIFRRSVHEVGHAFVGGRLGLTLRKVRISSDGRSCTSFRRSRVKAIFSAEYRRGVAVFFAAGVAAERLWFGEEEYLGSEGDAEIIFGLGKEFEQAVAGAEAMLSENLSEVVEIARVIARRIGGREGEFEFDWAELAC